MTNLSHFACSSGTSDQISHALRLPQLASAVAQQRRKGRCGGNLTMHTRANHNRVWFQPTRPCLVCKPADIEAWAAVWLACHNMHQTMAKFLIFPFRNRPISMAFDFSFVFFSWAQVVFLSLLLVLFLTFLACCVLCLALVLSCLVLPLCILSSSAFATSAFPDHVSSGSLATVIQTRYPSIWLILHLIWIPVSLSNTPFLCLLVSQIIHSQTESLLCWTVYQYQYQDLVNNTS